MRKFAKVRSVAFMLFLLVLKASAQDVVISGAVTDLEKGTPLESVSIRVVGKSTAT